MSYALPGYVTAIEAADELGVHRTMIQKYCKLGRIKAIQVGSAWFITEEEFKAYKAKPRHKGNFFHRRST